MPSQPAAENNPRVAAVRAMAEVLDEHRNLSECHAFARLKAPRDAAFAHHLAYAGLRWLSALEWLAGQLLVKPLKQRDSDVRRLLLLGLQQLWHGHTASHAAVNETAECARLLGKPWAVGLVNAVLRRFQRERSVWLQQLAQVPEHFAHPDWLLQAVRADWPQQWQDVIAANNLQAPLWLRINRLQHDVDGLRKLLRDAGFEVNPHAYARDAISITPAVAVDKIPGFQQGRLSVQDPAAQLAGDLIDPQPGERILDACAAPGGKTAHLLERCPQVELTVLDKRRSRLAQVHQNLRRLGLSAQTYVADAGRPDPWWNGVKFDKILLDAPCSATGVIRRHPEIKWLRKPAQVDAVVQTQAGLLATLWTLLQADGVLVYATCSILERENSQQIQRFLQENNDAEVVDINSKWGQPVPGGRQIMPGDAQMDGFFYAVLRKKK